MRKKCLVNGTGRECSKCGDFKVWDEFDQSASERLGHQSRCKVCRKEYRDKNKEWLYTNKNKVYEENKDKTNINKRALYKQDEDYRRKCNAYSKEFYQNNTEKVKLMCREYRLKNKDKVNEWHKLWQRDKRKRDLSYRLLCQCRCNLHNSLNRQHSTKFRNTLDLIGCSPEDLLFYLNANASVRYGDIGVEIDHVIPCNYFDFKNPIEQLICYNWRNLRLMSKVDNIRKSNKLPDNGDALYNEILQDVLSKYPELMEG